MQKKFFFYLIILFLLISVIKLTGKYSSFPQSTKSPVSLQVEITPSITKKLTKKATNSIFFPYWSDIQDLSEDQKYDRWIYFGVAVTENGLNQKEEGYRRLEDFMTQAANYNKEKWLTLRMIDSDINLKVLGKTEIQEKIIKDTLNLLKNYKFDGLVLDLELSILPLDSTVNKINMFVQNLYKDIQGENLKLGLSLYGDNFYRKRPFDLSYLVKNSDEIMIMAYDLHKARGEPGPNFPLYGKQKYGYDLQTMIDDFSKFAENDKLSVIFGMYGYDWMVDIKKRPIKAASPMSVNEINNKIITGCKTDNCVVRRDDKSKETEINYVDSNTNLHIVWFEDGKSVEEKMKFLKTKGIVNYVYWAYGYF